MGNIVRLGIVGLLLYGLRAAGQTISAATGKVQWEMQPIRRSDIRLNFREGRLVAIIKVRLSIINKNPVSIYLQGYRAVISQEGNPLGSLATTTRIELPSNEPRTLEADFTIPGGNLVNRLQDLLEGKGSAISPIRIDGELELGNGLVLPIRQQLELFALT